MRFSKHLAPRTSHLAPRRGQALVEVLVAISILSVGFLGIVSLLSRALSLNRVVADNYTATYLASEGIELTKNIIDANFEAKRGWGAGLSENPNGFEVDINSTNSLRPYSDQPLLIDPVTNEYSYTGSEPSPFKRQIVIKLINGGQEEIQVNSIVTWVTRGGGTSRIDLEDHFFNWR